MLHINNAESFSVIIFGNSLLSFLTFSILSLYPVCYVLCWSDSGDSKFEYAVCEGILRSNVIKYILLDLS